VKRALTAAAILAVLAAVLAVSSLPPATLALEGTGDGSIPGVIHVHTNRSDGLSSPDEIAAAASRAGLSFVIFTDHGDGTRPPDPPTYRSGVLCLDAVEISTSGGHYVALGLPAAPYPLGGDARDVVEDIHRLGGIGIAAHPDSPKEDLQWRDWSLPIDGVEILNLDTVWRGLLFEPGWRPKTRLLRALLAYPVRSEESIGNLLTVSSGSAAAYTALTARRRATAVVAVDAHSKLALREVDPGDNRWALPFPGYETVFRTLQVRLTAGRALSGDAAADAAIVLDALRNGQSYGANAALASPPSFEFHAEGFHGFVAQGGVLDAGMPATLRVRSNAPQGFRTRLLEGAEVLVDTEEQVIELEVGGTPAVYRVEIVAAERPWQPVWIVSNPIYVRPRTLGPEPPLPFQGEDRRVLFDGGTTAGWRVERDERSLASMSVEPARPPLLRLDYQLAHAPATNQFAALVVETPGGLGPYGRLALRVRSNRPARLSVQARAAATPAQDHHWVRSVYVDGDWRDVVVPFDEFRPLVEQTPPTLSGERIHSLLFAMELTNTAPGSSGRIELERVALEP
jgi:hypothetical protein